MSKRTENPGRTVLLIEDDSLLRASLCELLASFGIGVCAAGTAAEAVLALRKRSFDAVITDLNIPGNGITVVRYAAALRPGLPVIILSAAPPSRDPVETAFRRLQKPVSVDTIRGALRDAFA